MSPIISQVSSRLFLSISVLVILSFCPVAKSGPTVTSTITESRTVTQTNIFSSNYACAKLVNVTGACRRRRGFPIDEPVILTFDDDIDESVEQAFHQSFHPQFIPTRTLGVEATPVVLLPHTPVMIPILSEPYNSQIQSRSPSSFGVSPSNRNVIESSKQSMNRKKHKDPATSRIYFAELYGLLRVLLSQLQGPTTTQTVTVTQVFTEVSQSRQGTTATFFIMGCTPNPLPYPTCAATGKR